MSKFIMVAVFLVIFISLGLYMLLTKKRLVSFFMSLLSLMGLGILLATYMPYEPRKVLEDFLIVVLLFLVVLMGAGQIQGGQYYFLQGKCFYFDQRGYGVLEERLELLRTDYDLAYKELVVYQSGLVFIATSARGAPSHAFQVLLDELNIAPFCPLSKSYGVIFFALAFWLLKEAKIFALFFN